MRPHVTEDSAARATGYRFLFVFFGADTAAEPVCPRRGVRAPQAGRTCQAPLLLLDALDWLLRDNNACCQSSLALPTEGETTSEKCVHQQFKFVVGLHAR